MFKKVSSLVLLTAVGLTGCNNSVGNAVHSNIDGHSGKFTADQQHAIEKIASEYIIQHPEVLIKASQQLQMREYKRIDTEQRQTVFNNLPEIITPTTPSVIADAGHKPSVKVVEFFDYQCAFCSKLSPVIEKIASNKDVELVFKETPIFGSHWAASSYAANVGNAIFKQFGGKVYLKYHNAVFDSHKDEGRLTNSDVDAAVKLAGVDLKVLKISDSTAKTMALFAALGFRGTPMVIVMKSDPKSASDIKLIRGYSPAGIDAAIKELKA